MNSSTIIVLIIFVNLCSVYGNNDEEETNKIFDGNNDEKETNKIFDRNDTITGLSKGGQDRDERVESHESQDHNRDNSNQVEFISIRHYPQCESNNQKFIDCKRIDYYIVGYLPSDSCDTESCAPDIYVYNVTYNGKKIETFVNYPNKRVLQGSSTGRQIFQIGTVTKGFLKGATITEVVDLQSVDPNACSSKYGLTELKGKFAVITFQTENVKVVCYGNAIVKFMPGLRSNN